MTDFTRITACGECCHGCPKKADGRCPGCIEADGQVPEWAGSGRCRIHACARAHHVQFCGLCEAFPCEKLPSLISWNADIVSHLSALRDEYLKEQEKTAVDIIVKKMETDEEIKGKAFVHWQSWHEAYPGLVSQDYLDRFTLEKSEKMAFSWTDNLLVAIDKGRVIGFVGYGCRRELPEEGEIFAIYILSEYYGKGVGLRLMEAGLKKLKDYPKVNLWVLKGNNRAIRFYEKCGFCPDGNEMYNDNVKASEIRMTLVRS